VVASAEGFADGAEGAFGHSPREEHGDLPRERDVLGAAFAGHVGETDVEVFGDFLLDGLDADGVAAFLVEDLAQQAFHDFQRELFAGQRGVGGDADERAFEAPDVGADAVREEIENFRRQHHAHGLRFLVQNREAHLDVGGLEIGHKSPFEAGHQAMLEILDFAGGTVAGENDLFVRFVKRIEGVEELLLDPFLAGEELDVVNQQHVRLAIFLPKLHQLVVLDAVDVFVGELFGGDVGDTRAFAIGDDVLSDGVQQVGFAEADAAVEEQGVVGFAGRLGDREGRGVGEIVVVAHDERFKRVPRIKAAIRRVRVALGRRSRRVLRFWLRGGLRGGVDGAGADLELDLQLFSGGQRDHVLEQTHVVVFQPDLAKVVGYLQDQTVTFQPGNRQGSKPQIVGVGTEHRAQLILRRLPNFFRGSLHFLFPKARFLGVLFTKLLSAFGNRLSDAAFGQSSGAGRRNRFRCRHAPHLVLPECNISTSFSMRYSECRLRVAPCAGCCFGRQPFTGAAEKVSSPSAPKLRGQHINTYSRVIHRAFSINKIRQTVAFRDENNGG